MTRCHADDRSARGEIRGYPGSPISPGTPRRDSPPRAWTITATASTMIAPATIVRGSSGSARISQPADRDHRVHEGVGRDERDRRNTKQPHVGGVADQGAGDDEIGEREHGFPRDLVEADPEEIARQHREDEEDYAAGEHLHGRSHQGPLRNVGGAAEERAGRPEHRGEQEHRDAERVRSTRAPDRSHEDDDPDEADDGSRDDGPGQHHAEEQPTNDRDPQWQGGDDERRDPRGDGLLADRHEAVAARQQEAPDDGGVAPLATSRPIPGRISPADGGHVQQRSRDEEADGGLRQRWDRLHGDPNGEIGRAPDEVQGDQGDADPDRRRGRSEGARPGMSCLQDGSPGEPVPAGSGHPARRPRATIARRMSLDDRFDDLVTSLGGFYRAWVIQLGLELGLFSALRAAGATGLTAGDLAAAASAAPGPT